jgi:hypothetical protein
MRLPWSKSRIEKTADSGPVSLSQAALSGPDGDGKEHDLAYWLASGFLTLPKGEADAVATAAEKPSTDSKRRHDPRPAPRTVPAP